MLTGWWLSPTPSAESTLIVFAVHVNNPMQWGFLSHCMVCGFLNGAAVHPTEHGYCCLWFAGLHGLGWLLAWVCHVGFQVSCNLTFHMCFSLLAGTLAVLAHVHVVAGIGMCLAALGLVLSSSMALGLSLSSKWAGDIPLGCWGRILDSLLWFGSLIPAHCACMSCVPHAMQSHGVVLM